MRAVLLSLAALSASCTKSVPDPDTHGRSNEQEPAPEKSTVSGKCQTDLDCETCGGATDCRRASASCWAGRCVLRHEAASPCASDDECEVREGDCRCDLYPALASAPVPEEGCVGVSCGTRPNPRQFIARCDPDAHRCVLQQRIEVPDFELSLACSMHGVGISEHRLEVSSAPPLVRSQDDEDEPRKRILEREALGPLWSVLRSPGFAAFIAETPKEGAPHPGMTTCMLSVSSPDLEVESKRWMSDDEFSESAAAAQKAMHVELGNLRQILFKPVKLNIDLDGLDLPSHVKRDRLEKDLDLLPRFANVFPPRSLRSVASALEEQGTGCKVRKQGFGIEVRTCGIGGGYSRCHAILVSHDERLVEVSASCRVSERSWDDVRPAIEKAYELALDPVGFQREGNIATYELRDPKVLAAAQADVASELRPQSGTEVPVGLEEAFQLLTSPRANLEVGTYCGAAGSAPAGHRAMKQLVKAERADLLRDALHGMNAGGRLYGYVGLKLLGKNTPADDAIFDIVTHLDIKIETCGGCTIDKQKPSDVDLTGFKR